MKFTTFEESIGNGRANSERKGPDPKLRMRQGETQIFGKQELIKGTTSVYKMVSNPFSVPTEIFTSSLSFFPSGDRLRVNRFNPEDMNI